MRTTVTLAADVAAAVEQGRAEGRGVSEVINELARRGLSVRAGVQPFRQRRHDLGRPAVPLDDVAAAVAWAEGDDHA